eukprot:COSAG01_NODE_683_length_14253_cov_33.540837_9_plen_153_part_00
MPSLLLLQAGLDAIDSDSDSAIAIQTPLLDPGMRRARRVSRATGHSTARPQHRSSTGKSRILAPAAGGGGRDPIHRSTHHASSHQPQAATCTHDARGHHAATTQDPIHAPRPGHWLPRGRVAAATEHVSAGDATAGGLTGVDIRTGTGTIGG